MLKYPLEFNSEARSSSSVASGWTIKSGSQSALCDIPLEFGGQGNGFSPEDLFLQACVNCFIGTFKVIAQQSRLKFGEVDVKAQLFVDKNDEGQVVMKTINLDLQFKEVDRLDRLETLVSKTLRDGFILNSVKTKINYKLINH